MCNVCPLQVGYGDVVILSTAERLYACFAMLLGAISFAYMLGNVQVHLSRLRLTCLRLTRLRLTRLSLAFSRLPLRMLGTEHAASDGAPRHAIGDAAHTHGLDLRLHALS